MSKKTTKVIADKKEEKKPRVRKPGPVPLQLTLSPTATLAEARYAVSQGVRNKKGVICPCCEQQTRIYYRRVNLTMIKVLWQLARHHAENDGEWASVPNLFKNAKYGLSGSTASHGGQWAQMEKWQLVERRRGVCREDGSPRTGDARITALGLAFLANRYSIREHGLFYNNTLLGKSGKLMGANDVRGFDYMEIFNGERPASSRFEDEELFANKNHFIDVSKIVFGDSSQKNNA